MKTSKPNLIPSNRVPVAESAGLAPISLPAFGQDCIATGGGNLRNENSSGHRITDSDYDPAAVFGLKLNIKL